MLRVSMAPAKDICTKNSIGSVAPLIFAYTFEDRDHRKVAWHLPLPFGPNRACTRTPLHSGGSRYSKHCLLVNDRVATRPPDKGIFGATKEIVIAELAEEPVDVLIAK